MNDNRAWRTTTLWTHSVKTLTLIAWLGVWIQRTAGQGPGAEVVTVAAGQTATLNASITTGIAVFAWYRGTETLASQLIISYVVPSSSQTNGPQFTGRESGSPNGTLHIRDLQRSDTGNYTVNVTPNIGPPTPVTRQLRVYEMVTKPIVNVNSPLVENRGPVEITCDNSSAAVTILWYFNSTSALPGNIIQSPNNRTLTIANVSRGDSGVYQCVAMNPISSKTSDPQPLTVAYGPEDVKIYPTGSQVLQVGAKLSLSCTADSFPEPQYKWFLNGTDLKRPGKTYTVEVSSRDNGNYTCLAENTLTGLSAKVSVSITVNGTDLSPDGSAGLSAGAIVGIVIGVLAVVIIVCVLVYIFVIKKPASGAAAAGNSTEMAPNNNEGSASPKANGTAAEIQYSSVNFVPKRGTPAKPVSPENTVYSEVRR